MSIQAVVSKRLSLVWLLLVLATLTSWELGHGFGLSDPRLAGSAILVVAVLKVRLILLDFMELRHAPVPFRLAVEGWSGSVVFALVLLYRGTV